MTEAYPLHWPQGYPRQRPIGSKFSTSLPGALKNVRDELIRFGNDTGKKVESLVLSSNVTLGEQKPEDGAVAAYFRWDGIDCCIAVDRYKKPEENLQAIFKVLEAERTKMRHGGLNIVRAAMRGYASLPPPTGKQGALPAPWRKVLFGDPKAKVTADQVETRYRELVKQEHPDVGGDAAKFAQIVDATRAARMEFADG